MSHGPHRENRFHQLSSHQCPLGAGISQYLTYKGYDVFFDYTGLASGDFKGVILDNIHARVHFVVLLTPSALERCGEPSDWLRLEIEEAIDSKRNIVPLMLEGFDFGSPSIANQLTGKLRQNGQEVHTWSEHPDALIAVSWFEGLGAA